MSGRSSRAGSVGGSQRPTPSGSQAGSAARGSGQFPDQPKQDNRPELTPVQRLGKRVDLPADAYKEEVRSSSYWSFARCTVGGENAPDAFDHIYLFINISL